MSRRLRRRYGAVRADMSWLTNDTRSTAGLHQDIAVALGWPLRDVQSFSMHTLRELVRPVNPKLAEEITHAIRSRRYIT